MGLSIVVGVLTQQKADLDPEEFREFASIFENLNTVLLQNGRSLHNEPLNLVEEYHFEADMMGYGGLHYIRRLASHLAINGKLPPPAATYEISDTDDPVTEELNALIEKNGYKSKKQGLWQTCCIADPNCMRI